MTASEIRKALRFLYRFNNLCPTAKNLEEAILFHMEVRNAAQLTFGAFRAALENGKLVITRRPQTDERQIDFLAEYFCLKYEKGGTK